MLNCANHREPNLFTNLLIKFQWLLLLVPWSVTRLEYYSDQACWLPVLTTIERTIYNIISKGEKHFAIP